MTLIRDCCLSLGLFDEAAASFPAIDVGAMLGLAPAKDSAERTEETILAALADTHLVIDEGLASLDAITLLRFCRWPGEDGGPTTVAGPSSLKDIVDLMPGRRFLANDLPRAEGHDAVQRGLPLSIAIALPETMRGGMSIALPYIVAPDERRAIWRRSLAGLPRPLIAVAWDATRPGLMLDDYRAAFEGIAGTLVSTMWDDTRLQLAGWPAIIDAGVHFQSLADLAAVIAETDLIIGPDGIPLHVAGAMGKPGLLLTLPNWPWYWHNQDGVSSWYPSIRVLQTKAIGNWSRGIEDISPVIGDFCRALGAPSLPSNDHHSLNLDAAEGGKP